MALPWLPQGAESVQPLPAHCEPTNGFLRYISVLFDTCLPTPAAWISTSLGLFSITAWLFAQLPQILKNARRHSTDGIAPAFLMLWLLGDGSNLVGGLFTGQAQWQIILAGYYVLVDCILILQVAFYPKMNIKRVYVGRCQCGHLFDDKLIKSKQKSYGTAQPVGAAGPPRKAVAPPGSTLMLLSMVLCFASAGLSLPVGSSQTVSPPAVMAFSQGQTVIDYRALFGTLISWLSTVSYLLSRIPQLLENSTRKSTSGLSMRLVFAAFCGNLFYSSSLVTNPCAWNSFGPFGSPVDGKDAAAAPGWVGAEGSDQAEWIARALPFLLGASGVLFFDGMLMRQWWRYGGVQQALPGQFVGTEQMRVSGQITGSTPYCPRCSGGNGQPVPSGSSSKMTKSTQAVHTPAVLIGPSGGEMVAVSYQQESQDRRRPQKAHLKQTVLSGGADDRSRPGQNRYSQYMLPQQNDGNTTTESESVESGQELVDEIAVYRPLSGFFRGIFPAVSVGRSWGVSSWMRKSKADGLLMASSSSSSSMPSEVVSEPTSDGEDGTALEEASESTELLDQAMDRPNQDVEDGGGVFKFQEQ